jgi:RNA polymerase sigma-70 factor (ECF subfamily)
MVPGPLSDVGLLITSAGFRRILPSGGLQGEVAIDPAAAKAVDPGWEALARVAAGDAEAFAVLVESHQERLLRLCERLLGDLEEARDAAQEVFLKAYRKAADVRPGGQVYTWLYRIAVNHCLNKLRRRKLVRFLRWEDAGDPEGPAFDPPDGAPDPAATLETRRRWQATQRAIAKLPENQQAVVVLVRFEGLSYKQTADVLGITEGAVESRLVPADVLGITEGAVESRLVRAMRRLEAAQEAAGSGVSPGERAI